MAANGGHDLIAVLIVFNTWQLPAVQNFFSKRWVVLWTLLRSFLLVYSRIKLFRILSCCIINKLFIYFFIILWPCIVTDSLWIKPTDALNTNFTGIKTLFVSGKLSAHHQEFLAVYRLWYILCSCDHLLPGVGWNSILLLVANDNHICIKCTKAHIRLRTPDNVQKGCPKHLES